MNEEDGRAFGRAALAGAWEEVTLTWMVWRGARDGMEKTAAATIWNRVLLHVIRAAQRQKNISESFCGSWQVLLL